ncbi:unnamed protein product, partial [Sphacelaria rigidula]
MPQPLFWDLILEISENTRKLPVQNLMDTFVEPPAGSLQDHTREVPAQYHSATVFESPCGKFPENARKLSAQYPAATVTEPPPKKPLGNYLHDFPQLLSSNLLLGNLQGLLGNCPHNIPRLHVDLLTSV